MAIHNSFHSSQKEKQIASFYMHQPIVHSSYLQSVWIKSRLAYTLSCPPGCFQITSFGTTLKTVGFDIFPVSFIGEWSLALMNDIVRFFLVSLWIFFF